MTDLSEDQGFLLISYEVVTGFRVSPGTYQERVGVTPDLTTLGKIAGGGAPVGALCGRPDVFEPAKPDAPPEERVLAGGGTFTANPITAVAGLATLDVIGSEPVYEHSERLGSKLRDGLETVFDELDVSETAPGLSSLAAPVFNADRPVESLSDVKEDADGDALAEFHGRLYDRGYYFNQGSMGNVFFAIAEDHIDELLEDARDVVRCMKDDGIC